MSNNTRGGGRGGGGGGGWRGRGSGSGGGWRGRGGWRGGGGGWKGGGGGWRGGGGNWRGNNRMQGGGMMPPPSSQSSQNNTLMRAGSSQPQITTMLPAVPTPYKGWHLYMNEGYSDGSETVKFVQAFEEYFSRLRPTLQRSEIEDRRAFHVNLKVLLEDGPVKEKIQEISDLVLNSPQRIISCLGLALHQLMTKEVDAELREEAAEVLAAGGESVDEASLKALVPEADLPLIHARLVNHCKLTPLKVLKANYYGKLVSIKGTVVRVGSIKPLCTRLAFTCLGCSTVHGVTQTEGRYTVPSLCPVQNCRSRSFVPDRSHKLTHTVDWQSFRLQEIISDDQREGGRVPRTVECEVREDLVDSCVPGDMITITGIVKVSQSQEGKGNKGDKCMFMLYIDATSVTNCKSGDDAASAVGIEFSIKDYYAIQEIQAEPQLFKLLVGSLCPAIYGHELVKAGLLLCLFGGCSKTGGDRVPVRGDPHILVVGDPGLGKSQMLQACSNVAPRGVYVCGNTTTTSGLTVTLSREGGTGDYALEGGALVMADQGVCCIDEFDKMTNQHLALLEAMEQQSISIAKAGIVCSLPARTSILAAANPIGGHYNKAKTVSENLKMNSALLSRFDLVFILLDKPDEELDCLLSEHVMALHSRLGKQASDLLEGGRVRKQDLLDSSSIIDSEQPLSERLKHRSSEPFAPIPHHLLRKYICYARKYVQPKITKCAAKIIQQFYLDLRQRHQNANSTPITTRQLESLIRLTEARARCELREEATEEDAREVVEVMRFSMMDTFSDEFGFLDFKRSQHGSGSSNRSQMKKFVAVLQRMSEKTYKSIFTIDEMKQLVKQANIQVRDINDLIASLNHQGYLLKKGSRVYQLLTANC
ncbi:DNA helicase MCM8-like [Penaeus chinensis]|uniref:DNA helicase MCM8-like n=1 Tax=Penaeus chinensis TaxID=139456 RepID=UPI001FB65E5E|nr:DNA helicase MCM8-like [Penaeus chinensis]XP_047500986.1 DNA helicase MCM8-like [Penaeus chinensis]